MFQQTHEAWRQVFLLTAIVFIGCNIVFILFGSGSIQHWNKPQEFDENENKKREIKKEMLSMISDVIKTP